MLINLVAFIAGLALLMGGSDRFVTGTAGLARNFGISPMVVGLTVVAIDTSLPELASSLASVLRGEPDMAVGNVLGSNMFNLLPVLGIAGFVQPFQLAPRC